MFQKDMKKAYLLDFYGEVLDEHTRSIVRAYYEDDLSLSEIAEDEGISRQGVRHIIKKGEEQLSSLEDSLGLCEHYEELRTVADSLSVLADEARADGTPDAMRRAAVLYSAVQTILNKGV